MDKILKKAVDINYPKQVIDNYVEFMKKELNNSVEIFNESLARLESADTVEDAELDYDTVARATIPVTTMFKYYKDKIGFTYSGELEADLYLMDAHIKEGKSLESPVKDEFLKVYSLFREFSRTLTIMSGEDPDVIRIEIKNDSKNREAHSKEKEQVDVLVQLSSVTLRGLIKNVHKVPKDNLREVSKDLGETFVKLLKVAIELNPKEHLGFDSSNLSEEDSIEFLEEANKFYESDSEVLKSEYYNNTKDFASTIVESLELIKKELGE